MHRTAYLLLALTALMWGANAVAGKMAVGHISPMVLTLLRWLLALVLMTAIGWRQFRRDWPVTRRHLPLLFLLGAGGFTLFNAFMYSALTYTSAINISIEQAAVPMAIMALNFLFFATRVTWLQLGGFVLSIVGVAVVAAHGDLSRLAQLDVNFGDALMMVAVLFYSAYTVALRYKPRIHWQSLMLVLVFAALVTTGPFVAAEVALEAAIWPDATGWALVAFTAVFPSILAQVFYIRGVEMIGPNRAGLFVNLVPIFGTLLAIVLIGEQFNSYHAVAFALVMGGIAMAETGGRRMAASMQGNKQPLKR